MKESGPEAGRQAFAEEGDPEFEVIAKYETEPVPRLTWIGYWQSLETVLSA